MSRNEVLDLAYDVANLDDEEFIEFFVALKLQMLDHIIGSVDPEDITKEAIYDLLEPVSIWKDGKDPYRNLFHWLYCICREVICEDDIDSGAWWKHGTME